MSKSTWCSEWEWDVRPTWAYLATVLGSSLAPVLVMIFLKRVVPEAWTVVGGGAALAAATVVAAVVLRLVLQVSWSVVVGAVILAAAVLVPAILTRDDPSRTRALTNAAGGLAAGLFFLGTIPPSRSRRYAIAVATSIALAVVIAFFIV